MDRNTNIKEWLVQNSMEQYQAALINTMAITDLQALSKLDTSDLSCLGITKGKEKRRVSACILKLKEHLASPTGQTAGEIVDPKKAGLESQKDGLKAKSRKSNQSSHIAEEASNSHPSTETTEQQSSNKRTDNDTTNTQLPSYGAAVLSDESTSETTKNVESRKTVASNAKGTDMTQEIGQISVPHLFHADNPEIKDLTKEIGRSEEDTEIRSSNSADRETRRTQEATEMLEAAESISAPKPKKAKRHLPIDTHTSLPTNEQSLSSNSSVPSVTRAPSGGNLTPNTAPLNATSPNAEPKQLEGYLQLKKGGFFRLTKKWEARWCTFGGRIFEAYKNKDDKDPALRVDITKAIVTGTNDRDRDVQVLELIAQGKRSYWTGTKIEDWIKMLKSMSIKSLNAKRRTSDYMSYTTDDVHNIVFGDISQSLDVATEEEDRNEDIAAAAFIPQSTLSPTASPSSDTSNIRTSPIHSRRAKTKQKRPRKSDEVTSEVTEAVFQVNVITKDDLNSNGGKDSGSTHRDNNTPDLIAAKAKVKSTPSLQLVPPHSTDGQSQNTTTTKTKDSKDEKSLKIPDSEAPSGTAGKSSSNQKSMKSEKITVTTQPGSGTEAKATAVTSSKPRRDHHGVPKKTISVGNLSAHGTTPTFTSNNMFRTGRRLGRAEFDDQPCLDALGLYRRQQETLQKLGQSPSSSTAPLSPGKEGTQPNSAYISLGLDEESEFEESMDDEVELELKPTSSFSGDSKRKSGNEVDPRALRLIFLYAIFQIVSPRTASEHKPKWTSRHCTFDGSWIRTYLTQHEAKVNNPSSSISSYQVQSIKVTPIFISRVICLDIWDEDSGRREFWRGPEVLVWLPQLERVASRSYDVVLTGLLVRQRKKDNSLWIARYCTFNGHQFQIYRQQGDSIPMWSAHIRHVSTKLQKSVGGVELMELLVDGAPEFVWWVPPPYLVEDIVDPIVLPRRFNIVTGSMATTSGGDTPSAPSILGRTAPTPYNQKDSNEKDSHGTQNNHRKHPPYPGGSYQSNKKGDAPKSVGKVLTENLDLDTRNSSPTATIWAMLIREYHEISIGDSERYIADEWEEDEDNEQQNTISKDNTEEPSMKGNLNYKVGKKTWEPRYCELVGKTLIVMKKKHDKKPENSIKLGKSKVIFKKESDEKTNPQTLEIATEDSTFSFSGKGLSLWAAALKAQSKETHSTRHYALQIDPTELSAAESRSESTRTSSHYGAKAEESEQIDDSRSEDIRREAAEEQPRSASTSATATTNLLESPTVRSHSSSSRYGKHLASINQESRYDATTEDSSNESRGLTPKPSQFKNPNSAIESIKSISYDTEPTAYYSDADDNQFAVSVEGVPKPSWTGAIARYRPQDHNWVGRYVILRPGTDMLVYLWKPSSIETVPPLATIDLAGISAVSQTTIDGHASIELMDSNGVKHIWYCSDNAVLADLIEASRVTARSKPKKKATKKIQPVASPKKVHRPKLSHMSGSSPQLEIPRPSQNSDKPEKTVKSKQS